MKRQNGKNCLRVHSFFVLPVIIALLMIVPANVTAKSLYVIADITHLTYNGRQPVQAYNIEADGTLTFQTEHLIPHTGLGAIGITIDTDHEYLFITYEYSDEIRLVDARTMTDEGVTLAPDARHLAGVVYDHDKGLLYTVDRNSNTLYVYNWEPEAKILTHVENSPFELNRATAWGIALNEIEDLLYVANGTNKVTVYRTSDWRLVNTITLDRVAISVAVGVVRGFLYTGGGYAGNMYLTQYNLATGEIKEVQVEPDAGIMGLGVDPATGYVYLTTGMNNAPGGDNLLVYDTKLNQIDIIPKIGNPTGLVVPGKEIGYNPFNLRKTLVSGGSSGTNPDGTPPSVALGATITYGISFDNFNDYTATGVMVTDTLPEEVTFIAADEDGVNAQYDPQTHTYEWFYPSLPSGASTNLELTVEVNKDVESDTLITNTVTIRSNQTAPTTRHLDVAVESNTLNITKVIAGTAEGEVAVVDADELMTYTICFDNNENDFPITNVSVVDSLPDEVRLIGPGKETPSGKYNAADHTYTWTFSSLAPSEAVCLDLNVQVNKDVAPGTTFINTVTIDSDETPPSTASAKANTYHGALNLRKSVAGADKDEMPVVSINETVTYEIHFDNMNGDAPVHNVILTDVLPPEVSFVKAADDGPSGQYDPKTHTYTWLYGTLSPQTGASLELVVRVNEDAPPATTITNYVTLDSDETRPITASADVATTYKPLNIRKEIVGDLIGGTGYASPGDTVTYHLCFDNDNAVAVTNVTVIDLLPNEVVFVSATGDKEYGRYDEKTHTYTWSYKSIAAKSTTCETLQVQIKEDTPRGKIIVNKVKIKSDQTDESENPPDDNEINTGDEPLLLQQLSILPEIIRDTDDTYEIQATAILPAGIGKKDIEDAPPILYLPEPYSAKIVATRQIIYSSDTRAKVIALFDKKALLNAIPARGQFTLTVVGKLKKGQSWYGKDTVYLTEYTGR